MMFWFSDAVKKSKTILLWRDLCLPSPPAKFVESSLLKFHDDLFGVD